MVWKGQPKSKRHAKYRRSRRRQRKNKIVRSLAPKTRLVKLRYSDAISLVPTAGGVAGTHYFSCNGMYDPDITGVGHQPLGFDQYMSMYDHYTVISSRITVIAAARGTAAGEAGIAAVYLNDNTSNVIAPNHISAYLEQPGCSFKPLALREAGNSIVTVVRKFNAKKDLGVSKPLSAPEVRGSVSSNPAEQSYFQLLAGPIDVTGTMSTINCVVTIDYVAVLTEPKDLAQS